MSSGGEPGIPPETGLSVLDLHRLGDGSTHMLTDHQGSVLAEAASVCLEEKNQQQGCRLDCQLDVEGHRFRSSQVVWPPADDRIRRTHRTDQKATEEGACGIAILLTFELTDYKVLELACKGSGVDYWLTKKMSNSVLGFDARLEVSGMLSRDDYEFARRINEKLAQTKRSDHTKRTAYVVVVEFETPRACLVERNEPRDRAAS